MEFNVSAKDDTKGKILLKLFLLKVHPQLNKNNFLKASY